MDRIIEKNKTYRIPHNGKTSLLRVLDLTSTKVKVLDLKTNKKYSVSLETFQDGLNLGTIYVSAEVVNFILAENSLKLFRGTQDIYPSKLNHSKVMDGSLGKGMYLSPDKKVAEWYAFKHCKKFGVVTEYQVADLDILKLNTRTDMKYHNIDDKFLELLPKGKTKLGIDEKIVSINDLPALVKRAGFDALEIDDRSDPVNEHMVAIYSPSNKIIPSNYIIRKWNYINHKYEVFEFDDAQKADSFIKNKILKRK